MTTWPTVAQTVGSHVQRLELILHVGAECPIRIVGLPAGDAPVLHIARSERDDLDAALWSGAAVMDGDDATWLLDAATTETLAEARRLSVWRGDELLMAGQVKPRNTWTPDETAGALVQYVAGPRGVGVVGAESLGGGQIRFALSDGTFTDPITITLEG